MSAVFALAQVVKQAPGMFSTLGLAAALVVAGWLSFKVSDVPGNLIAYGRRIMINSNSSKILYTGEGINSSIAISQWNDGRCNSMSAAKWKRPPSRTICGCSACSAICRRCSIRANRIPS
ncbi:MAG: hypothetical protein WDO73_25975 [Ignavibacteriota bacterium]